MRSLLPVLVATVIAWSWACAGAPTRSTAKDETAAERARREAKAAGEDDVSSQGKSWGGWRYTGSRDECFYVVGRKCFAELKDACKAAGCRSAKPAQCRVEGGGPASISCSK